MKPIVIFRFYSIEGPGYFATFLDNNHIPWQVIRIDAGDLIPEDVESFSAMVLMGGPMSINDRLPWIDPVLRLVRQAVKKDIPVLGHCLGGQLMSKALGGAVRDSLVREIGWGSVKVTNDPISKKWCNHLDEFEAFHWHGETFSIPDGATRLLFNNHCQNQAFVIGKHLALQCHVEMTSELVKTWCEANHTMLADFSCPTVQSEIEIMKNLSVRVSRLNKIADLLYKNWIAGVTLLAK